MSSVDFSSSSKEPQGSRALRRSESEMCIDPSNASEDKRTSTEAFLSADMPSAKRRAANPWLLRDSLSPRFYDDSAIEELCHKMAENDALVLMGKKLLESLEDAIAENGTSKFDAFTTVKEIWRNTHFNCLLCGTLERQDSFLPTMIQNLSKQDPQEPFEKRMSRIKEDHYFKSIVTVRGPVAMMRGLLIILIMCWSCEDVHPDLVEGKVRFPDDDDACGICNKFESKLSLMKMCGADDAIIKELRSSVDSFGEKEPNEFFWAVVNKLEPVERWLSARGSPIPDLLDEVFVMELAVELEKKKGHHLVNVARSFLEKLNSVDSADSGSVDSLVVKEHSDLVEKVLSDESFTCVLRAKTKQDPFFYDVFYIYNCRYKMRESSIAADVAVGMVRMKKDPSSADNVAAARMVRIKKDPFCADILKEREDAAVLRGLLLILIGYYTDGIDKLVKKLYAEHQQLVPRKVPREHKFIHYETSFAGDVEALEKAVRQKFPDGVDTGSRPPSFNELRRIQFQREAFERQIHYDVHGDYGFVLNKDGSVVHAM